MSWNSWFSNSLGVIIYCLVGQSSDPVSLHISVLGKDTETQNASVQVCAG